MTMMFYPEMDDVALLLPPPYKWFSKWSPMPGQSGLEVQRTMADTIAILQIHPKIQYLQLSVAADIFEPPTKSAKLYFVIL